MNDIPLSLLSGLLGLLIILSAFFSSSETAMMTLNRYRLRHLEKKNHRGAKSVAKLLQRPDRLIGVILIGNNLVNILASAIATIIALRVYGDAGIAAATLLLTLVILIFSEVTPKTIAALYPQKIAFPASFILRPMLYLLYPAVWLINGVSNTLARLFGVDPNKISKNEHLNPEELRTVVDEAGDLIPDQYQNMLLNILDLGKAMVKDIMIPRSDIFGLDIEEDIAVLLEKIRSTEYTRIPIYSGDINNIIGILHLRHAARFMAGDDAGITHKDLQRFMSDPYFVPASTPLPTQLSNFQIAKHRMGIVVDEYGQVQGLITLEDLLEEIVGEFTTNLAGNVVGGIQPCENNWYLIEGSTTIRDINRLLVWDLPNNGPKTLNGLMMEYLENIPKGHVSFIIDKYLFETSSLSSTMIEKAKVKIIGNRNIS